MDVAMDWSCGFWFLTGFAYHNYHWIFVWLLKNYDLWKCGLKALPILFKSFFTGKLDLNQLIMVLSDHDPKNPDPERGEAGFKNKVYLD
jgi:hypothetical protein